MALPSAAPTPPSLPLGTVERSKKVRRQRVSRRKFRTFHRHVLLLRELLQAELRLCLAYRVAFHADLTRVVDDSLAYFADGPALVELKHGFLGTSLGVTRVAESVGEVTYVLSATAVSP